VPLVPGRVLVQLLLARLAQGPELPEIWALVPGALRRLVLVQAGQVQPGPEQALVSAQPASLLLEQVQVQLEPGSAEQALGQPV